MKILGSYPKSRLRRLRKSKWIRDLVSETSISSKDLILPIFVREGKNKIETIKSMPGVKRYSVDKLVNILKEVKKNKIPMIALFPYTPIEKKSPTSEEAWNPDNLVNKATRLIKSTYPEIVVMLDVALDPYNSDGHDGLVIDNKILNDETLTPGIFFSITASYSWRLR